MTLQDSRTTAERAPVWGFLDTWPATTSTTLHLVVLPPGTTSADARRFRRAAEYPWIGMAGAEIVFALTGSVLGPLAGVLIATGCFFAGLVVVRRRAARTRAEARAITARGTSPTASDLERLVDRLDETDEALRAGRIDRVAHELVWAESWERIGALPHVIAAAESTG